MSTPFLNSTFGTYTGEKYSTGGVERVFLIPKNKVIAVAATLDGTGTKNIVTGFTLASGATFQEIVCVEDSAQLLEPFKTGERKFITQTLNFTVAATGADAIEAANKITLSRSHMAIVQKRDTSSFAPNGGAYYVAGLDFGLKPSDVSVNSGAKPEDGAPITFSLIGPNLGFAAELQVTPTDLATYVTFAD